MAQQKEQFTERVAAFRKKMTEANLKGYILPGADPHLSEYPPLHWHSRPWLSGFTGSAGTLIITEEKAFLRTDSRYFLQASIELEDTPFELCKLGLSDTPKLQDHFKNLPKGSAIGIDGTLISAAEAEQLHDTFEKVGLILKTDYNPLNDIWENRPELPDTPIKLLNDQYSGANVAEKIELIRRELQQFGCNSTVLGLLDETAWAFNIRGNDVEYNPVAVAFGLITEDEAILFIDPNKIKESDRLELNQSGIQILPYNSIEKKLKQSSPNKRFYIDKNKINYKLYDAIPQKLITHCGPSLVFAMKSVKNETEIEGFRKAMIKDGVALTRFFKWLEESLDKGENITEFTASKTLTQFRSEQPDYVCDSFETISGYNEHGAIVHYSVDEKSAATLEPKGVLLIDSGGQYLNGTTDITRTIALGPVEDNVKHDYTLVLRGMINLSLAIFPEGTRGSQLDILARQFMWAEKTNYLHGTGHGVGHYLNVHEGPQSIRMEENPTPLRSGMVTSNEPGIYRTGSHGIRIENLILTKEFGPGEFGKFLHFETLTLCYIDTSLIDKEMMSGREIKWLNRYHENVYKTLSPYLTDDECKWLQEKTNPIY